MPVAPATQSESSAFTWRRCQCTSGVGGPVLSGEGCVRAVRPRRSTLRSPPRLEACPIRSPGDFLTLSRQIPGRAMHAQQLVAVPPFVRQIEEDSRAGRNSVVEPKPYGQEGRASSGG
jgi:hypothetical protein